MVRGKEVFWLSSGFSAAILSMPADLIPSRSVSGQTIGTQDRVSDHDGTASAMHTTPAN